MSLPTLSVAIITYNQENYISQTLDSILTQKHNYSYEIIIGDDCSKDNTRKIINEYAEKFPSIIKPIYNEQNLGIIKNYFNVISHCSGEYIMECAGDDYWLPGKIEKQISLLQNDPTIGMVYSTAKIWQENKNCFSKKLFGSNKENFEDLMKFNDIPAPSVCFRNSLMKEYITDVQPIQKTWLMEDYPTWLWFGKNSKIKFINQPLCVYRENQESASHFVNFEKRIRFCKSTWDIQNFFAEKYNLPVKDFDVHEWYRKECITFLLNNYDKEIVKIYNEHATTLDIKSKVKKVIINNYWLFSLYKLLRK